LFYIFASTTHTLIVISFMKEKIIARLRALFPGVNFSKIRMDAIADKLILKITEETEIDEKLQDLNEVIPFADIAKHDDNVRAKEAKDKKDKADKEAEKKSEQEPEPTPPSPAPTPADDLKKIVADAVAAAVTPLLQKVTSLESGKIADTRKQIFEEKLKDARLTA